MTAAKADDAFPDFVEKWRDEFVQAVDEFQAIVGKRMGSDRAISIRAKIDHRFLYRVRNGDSFTMAVITKVTDAMNEIMKEAEAN